MKKGFLKSITESSKIKYTTAATIFTALVIAIAILANAIISVISENNKMYFDMTDEQIYTMSDAFKSVMDSNFEGTNAEVEIIFPFDSSEADSTDAIAYIHSTAKLIEQRYSDNVSVSYHDIRKEPDFYRELMKNGNADSIPTSQSIVIARKNESGDFTGQYHVYPMQSFFSVKQSDGSTYGYDGEYVFASSIIRLTLDENPTVYFTTGHGESVEIENGKPKSVGLVKMLEDIGFSVKLLDTTEVDGIPSGARSVVIYNPDKDFSAAETDMIDRFFLKEHGHVMCFMPYTNENLKNLKGLIETLTGITVVSGDKIEGDSDGTVRADISDNKATESYFSSVKSKPIIKNAGYLTISDRISEGDFYFGAGIQTVPLLQINSSTMFDQTRKVRTLMAISSSERFEDQTDYVYSYFLVCPSDGFATDKYLYEENDLYSNRDILYSVLHSTMDLQVPLNLDTKAFYEYKIDITERQSAIVTVVMTFLIPTVIVACGTFVIIRRKRR